jgi:hypothetical protein
MTGLRVEVTLARKESSRVASADKMFADKRTLGAMDAGVCFNGSKSAPAA